LLARHEVSGDARIKSILSCLPSPVEELSCIFRVSFDFSLHPLNAKLHNWIAGV
jgi:hypothetical protein